MTKNIIPIQPGIDSSIDHQEVKDCVNRLKNYADRHSLGIALVMEQPNGNFISLTPIGARRVWTLGVLRFLEWDIVEAARDE